MGGKDRSDGVGMFVAEKWVDSVVKVKRLSERVLILKMVFCIPQNEMVVLAGYMNRHVGGNSVGYDGTHGGYGYGDRNADGSRIFEICRWAKSSHLQYTVHEAGI